MSQYQVAIIPRPQGWRPERPDDVPPQPGPLSGVLTESDDLFVAVRQAIEDNERVLRESGDRWAVVVEPGSRGRVWPTARLCTPINYKVTAIWWPGGWEPASPLDVPACVWQAQEGAAEEPVTYAQAENSIRALNRQCMDHPGTRWYVVVGVENEPISRTVSYDAGGAETTTAIRRMHVIRPEEGGSGDCSFCPAHRLPCTLPGTGSPPQTVTLVESRATGSERG